jgi:adenylate cyclase
MAEQRLNRRLAAIVAADVVGYSRLMEANEAGTLVRLKELRRDVFDPTTERFGGRIFKNTGDGALAEFPSAVDALQCMIDIQRELGERNASLSEDQRFVLRVGISLGDVIVDGDDLYGNGVNVAARMETLAETGGICVSGTIHEHAAGAIDVTFEDLGPQQVKNIERPVQAFRLNFEAGVMTTGAPGFSFPGSSDPETGAQLNGAPSTGAPLALPEKPSIAVLPFQNMSGDAEQEFFADGMAEDIITTLSHYRSLFVIARNSTFAYKGQSPDLRELSRDLGVRYVLEGSVRKGGSRIRVTAQLIEGATGNHIWAKRYDRELDDIFDLQDEMTQAIVSAIGPEIDQAERERAKRLPPESLDTWEAYQRGLWHLYRFTREDNAEAQTLFKRASTADSSFAPSRSGLTHALYYSFMHGYAEDREGALEEARGAGQSAIAIDERDADAHFALGRILYLQREWDASINQLEAAIALNPNFAHAHVGHGTALLWSGELAPAIEATDIAIRLSPHDPIMWLCLTVKALAQFNNGDNAGSEETMRQAIRQPTLPWTPHAILAAVLGERGKVAEARKALSAALKIKPDLGFVHLREIFPFRHPEHLEQVIGGLRKAGLKD